VVNSAAFEGKSSVIHHTVTHRGDGSSLSYGVAMPMLADDGSEESDGAQLRKALTAAAVRSGFDAAFFECAPVSRESAQDQPFEFVLVDAPALAAVQADSAPFAAHITDGRTAGQRQQEGSMLTATFLSLGGDALLVAPTLVACSGAGAGDCAHLLQFLRTAPPVAVNAWWIALGFAALQRLESAATPSTPVWLSTSGLGVYWLHRRLDSRPKYYIHRPFK
jgi:hypothetical protein